MYQHFLTTFFLVVAIPTTVLAATPNIDSMYTDFQSTQAKLFAAPVTKKDFSKRFKDVDAELKAKYEKIVASEKDELTIEGNQIAFELELLEPLRKLANSKFDKETCKQARHTNLMNTTLEDKAKNDLIEKTINSVCK